MTGRRQNDGAGAMTLELDGVTKLVAGRTHIHPTDLTLERGTMNVLLGPTLSGKTTLMRLMAGLDVPSAGRVRWNGTDVTGMRVQDRKVAMVYQQFINYPSMTVYDNIASPLRLMGKSGAEIDRAVRKTSDMMKLTPLLSRRPLELSGGQQQRCALARALVKDAGLVLLDEPLANLDYKLREELRAEIPKIFEESGAIFVYATTEPEEALLLGGQTATLWDQLRRSCQCPCGRPLRGPGRWPLHGRFPCQSPVAECPFRCLGCLSLHGGGDGNHRIGKFPASGPRC